MPHSDDHWPSPASVSQPVADNADTVKKELQGKATPHLQQGWQEHHSQVRGTPGPTRFCAPRQAAVGRRDEPVQAPGHQEDARQDMAYPTAACCWPDFSRAQESRVGVGVLHLLKAAWAQAMVQRVKLNQMMRLAVFSWLLLRIWMMMSARLRDDFERPTESCAAATQQNELLLSMRGMQRNVSSFRRLICGMPDD